MKTILLVFIFNLMTNEPGLIAYKSYPTAAVCESEKVRMTREMPQSDETKVFMSCVPAADLLK